MRLAALPDAPAAFGSKLAKWSGTGDAEQRWRARLRDVALNLVLVLKGEPSGWSALTLPTAKGRSN